VDANVNIFKETLYSHYLNSSAGASSHYKSKSAYETAKKRAAFYRYKVLHDERKYLGEFEKNFTLSGGKMFYAETAADALNEIKNIVAKVSSSLKGVKNHSNSSDILLNQSDIIREIEVETFLKKEGLPCTIANPYGNECSFISESYSEFSKKIMDAVATRAEQADFSENDITLIPEDLYKQFLLKKSYKKSIVIGSANFLAADMGSIVVRDSLGINTMSFLFGQTKIFIAGIDQLLASISDLSLYSRLYATIAHNSPMLPYQSIFSGRSNTYLIMIDNGRTEILSNPERRAILSCINCGACRGVCPTGNPVDFVKADRCNCCTLCGHCQEVCPVNIPLKDMMLRSRKRLAASGGAGFADDAGGSGAERAILDKSKIKTLTKMFLKRKNLEKSFDRFFLKKAFKKAFGTERVFPNFDKKTFNQIWMEQHPPVEK
jgi:L-lactate dehydrogenase complex protein LldF